MALITQKQVRFHSPLAWVRSAAAAIGGVVVGLLLASAIVTVLATQFFDFHVFAVSSGSMEPTLAKGTVVVTRPVSARDIKRGDIVLYRATEDVTIIHRVIGINTINLTLIDSKTGQTDQSTTYNYVTKGDANPTADSTPVDQRAVEGELWFELPGLPGALAGLRLQWLFLVVAVALAGAWVAWEVRHKLTRSGTGADEGS